MHCEAQPKPFPEALAIKKELEALVMRALAKSPDERFQSMEEMKEALLDIFGEDPVATGRHSKGKASGADGPAGGRERKQSEERSKKTKAPRTALAICVLGLTVTAFALAYQHFSQDNVLSGGRKAVTAGQQESIRPVESAAKGTGDGTAAGADAADLDLPPIPGNESIPSEADTLSVRELYDRGMHEPIESPLRALYLVASLKKDPQSKDAYEQLGDFYWKRYEKADAKLPNGPEARQELANQLKVYTAEINHRPKYYFGYECCAKMAAALGLWPTLLEDAEKGLACQHPADSELPLLKARGLHETKRENEAIIAYLPYIRKGDEANARICCDAYRATGRTREIIPLVTGWIKKFGVSSYLLELRARAEKDVSDYQAAIADYEALRKLDPNEYKAHLNDLEECRK
jgi:hypothetical protein